MSDQQASFRARPDVRFRTIGSEGVIVQQDVGQAIVVNEVGARILTLLAEGVATADIIARLRTEYAVEDQALEQDVQQYLAELQQAGVIDAVKC